MALNDTFTIQEMDLDTKNLHTTLRLKNLTLIGIKNANSILAITIAKFFAINTRTF